MGTGQGNHRYFRLYPRRRLVRAAAGRVQAVPQRQKRHHRRGSGGNAGLLRHDPFRRDGREILPGKTILEALNTDLVCDAINTAMRELFLQIVYGRTQTAFSDDGLQIGAGLEDLGKGLRSQVGTMYGTKLKGARYLEMAEGYVLKIALDKDDQICGYQFLSLGKMMDAIKSGLTPNEAYEKNIGTYGRFKAEDGAVKWIDPRKQ